MKNSNEFLTALRKPGNTGNKTEMNQTQGGTAADPEETSFHVAVSQQNSGIEQIPEGSTGPRAHSLRSRAKVKTCVRFWGGGDDASGEHPSTLIYIFSKIHLFKIRHLPGGVPRSSLVASAVSELSYPPGQGMGVSTIMCNGLPHV